MRRHRPSSVCGRRGPLAVVILGLVYLWALALPLAAAAPPADAITFFSEPGRMFVPVSEVASALRWKATVDAAGTVLSVNGRPVRPGSLRRLVGGEALASLENLASWGAVVVGDPRGGAVQVKSGWRAMDVVAGAQRVEISLRDQRLRGWQGGRLVLESRVSSGRRPGSTPTGKFQAGPYRARRHFSSRYHNAPMPWSVQVRGHVFIHGFSTVPRFPASHGCIRLPLDEGNPARFFFEWVRNGTPIVIRP